MNEPRQRGPTFSAEDGSSIDDAALAAACREGDWQAYATLIERHQKTVFNAAYRMLDNLEDARDVAQNTFLKVLEHIDGYDPRYKFYSWIYRIAVNESIDLLNRRKRWGTMPTEAASDEPGPGGYLGAEQMSRRVQAGLMTLNTEQRAVIVLKHFLGQSYDDIGQALGVPAKTVKSRLYSARQALKDVLKDEDLL